MDSYGERTPPEEQELVETPLEGRPIDTFRKFYADTAVFGAPHALRCALDFFGVDHILFASDMPFDPQPGQFITDTIADVDSLDISDEDRARIYEGNARELLGVEVPA
jgi:uncharacterized protein